MIDYTRTAPYMDGKKILYVHGFASSGATGTAKSIRQLLPKADVVSPDIPIDPKEAIEFLHETCEREKPDLIIGTSMGGMYTELLYGYDRILVNPAFEIAETIIKNNGLDRREFNNPRQDGAKDFLVTKGMVAEFKEVTAQCFGGVNDEERKSVFGMFGKQDTLVDTYDIFKAHYPNAIKFKGVHQLNDETLLHSVLPVIKWIDDKQEDRERPIIYVGLQDTLRYESGNNEGQPLASAVKAFRWLNERYDMYIVSRSRIDQGEAMKKDLEWVDENIGVPGWNRVIFTNQRNLLYGDYLIDRNTEDGAEEFLGTHLRLGDASFKTWEEMLTYFERLGGQ